MTAETTIVFSNLALEFSFGVYVLLSRMRFTKLSLCFQYDLLGTLFILMLFAFRKFHVLLQNQ